MKNILVPTDFSDSALNALKFAVKLALQQGSRIMLLHVFELPAAAGPVPFKILQEEKETRYRELGVKLKELIKQIGTFPEGRVSYEAREGAPADVILKSAEEWNADLVVMGTMGTGSFSRFFFGSVTTGVIERSACPVMAIPQEFSFESPVKEITFATNFLNSDIRDLKILAGIAQPFGASVTLLHIADGILTQEEEVKKLGEFMEKITASTSFRQVGFELINGEDVEKDIRKYLKKGRTDILVLSTQYRGFFGRLFSGSTTIAVAESADVPVIAFHHHKKEAVALP